MVIVGNVMYTREDQSSEEMHHNSRIDVLECGILG